MNIFLFLICLVITSCQTRVVPISKREYVNKNSGAEIYKKGRKITDRKDEVPQIFLKKKKMKINPVYEIENNGSLYSLDNPENFLFFDKPKGEVGDVLSVLVRVNQGEAPAGGQTKGELEADKLKDELLAALPEFELNDKQENVKPLTSIKFKVDRRLPNGDLIISTYRTSQNEEQSSSIRVQARIERSTLMAKKEISTNDLLDVDWYQRKDGEVVERDSLSWQDEYTLRMSGFDEAKSKLAQRLENKRQDLAKVRDRLKNRINTLGVERRQFSQAREQLDKQKKELADLIGKYDSQIDEQKTTIAEQKEIIKRQQELLDQAQSSESSESEGAQDE